MSTRRAPLASINGPPATWHGCCTSCSAGNCSAANLCGLAESDDDDTPENSPKLLAGRGVTNGDEAADDEAADGINIFSELIDILGVIHGKRAASSEKLERARGADRGIMDDVKLVADHWLRLVHDKENLPEKLTQGDRRRVYTLRKRARTASFHHAILTSHVTRCSPARPVPCSQ